MAKTLNNISGVAYAILSSASFGLIPLFSISLLMRGVGTPSILCYRFLMATAMMALVMLLTRRSFRISFRAFVAVVWLSVLYAATAIFILASYEHIAGGVATTIHFLYPLAVTAIMAMFFKERTTITTLIAAVVSLVGVALLMWGSHHDGDYRKGVLLALVTVATYAIYIVGVMKSRAATVDALTLTFYVLIVGAVIFFLYAILTTGIEPLRGGAEWRDAAMLALICTVISDLTLILAIKRIGSTMTSVLGSMEPLTAVIVGVLYFKEHFDAAALIGVVMIIVAVILVIVQSGRQHEGQASHDTHPL